MYYITVERDFDAAHALRGYRGKCENLHGHRFVVRATVKASKLDDIGLACDFTILKQHLSEILAKFDHHNLNEVPPFTGENPSSENIAALVYDEMKARLGKAPAAIDSIEVWESPTSHITYRPEDLPL
jgi:6-pyruvoyltetrahydropterin/6-carboxytetrahydropterin synthase